VLVLAACGGDERAATTEAGPSRALTAGWSTDFRRHSVPLSELQSGGTGKDGIRALDRPKLVAVEDVDFLEAREPVIELVVDGDARAYPIQILIWHEIVNDEVGGVPVAVTFCPLCNTSLVFDRRVAGGQVLSFGTTETCATRTSSCTTAGPSRGGRSQRAADRRDDESIRGAGSTAVAPSLHRCPMR
jgi:hypothetical protein